MHSISKHHQSMFFSSILLDFSRAQEAMQYSQAEEHTSTKSCVPSTLVNQSYVLEKEISFPQILSLAPANSLGPTKSISLPSVTSKLKINLIKVEFHANSEANSPVTKTNVLLHDIANHKTPSSVTGDGSVCSPCHGRSYFVLKSQDQKRDYLFDFPKPYYLLSNPSDSLSFAALRRIGFTRATYDMHCGIILACRDLKCFFLPVTTINGQD